MIDEGVCGIVTAKARAFADSLIEKLRFNGLYKPSRVMLVLFSLLVWLLITVTAHSTEEALRQVGLEVRQQKAEVARARAGLEDIQVDLDEVEFRVEQAARERDQVREQYEKLEALWRDNPTRELEDAVAAARERFFKKNSEHQAALKERRRLRARLEEQQATLARTQSRLREKQSRLDTLKNALIDRIATQRLQSLQQSSQVEGYGEASCMRVTVSECQKAAKQAAERDAAERGSIVVVQSITQMENFQLTEDRVRSAVTGRLSNVQVLEEGWIGRSTYKYRIGATVTPVVSDAVIEQVRKAVAAGMGLDSMGMSAAVGEGSGRIPAKTVQVTEKQQRTTNVQQTSTGSETRPPPSPPVVSPGPGCSKTAKKGGASVPAGVW